MTEPSREELPQSPTPDLKMVTAAYDHILKYNIKHTGFRPMLSGLFKVLMVSDGVLDMDNPDATTPKSTEEAYSGFDDTMQEGVVEGDMNAELQDIFHSDTFMRAGIKIAPFGQLHANGEGRAVTSTELVPVIENTSLFAEFLGKLQPEDVQNEGAEIFLSDVVANLSKVVGLCFDTSKHKDLSDEERAAVTKAGEDALRTFVTIDPEYARLGIDGDAMRACVEFMTKCVNYWGRNLLPEYLVAQRGQYLTPPAEQGFGPSNWQKDSGQHHWQEALGFLRVLEQDERTKPFAEEVRNGLVTSLNAALAELDDPTKNVNWRSQGSDLVNILNAITDQPFDEVKLADYIKSLTT